MWLLPLNEQPSETLLLKVIKNSVFHFHSNNTLCIFSDAKACAWIEFVAVAEC